MLVHPEPNCLGGCLIPHSLAMSNYYCCPDLIHYYILGVFFW